MKIAIVHDWLVNMGGAERIIELFHELYPEAPIYTLVYDKENMPDSFKKMDIRTSFIQKLPFGVKKYQSLLPLHTMAFEQFDLTEYDVVLSSNTACSKGVITNPETVHICYCNTPMRYAWNFYYEYMKNSGRIKRLLIPLFMNYIRLWDRMAADRVDYFIGNSHNVAKRIYKYYRRESTVINPPVNSKQFFAGDREGKFFLVVSRLVYYKRVDIAIRACNALELPLVIIGDGPERKNLEKIAGKTVTFLGRQPDKIIAEYYSKCRAFLFPGEEDFGITPLEAQASGKPVIAFGKGGVLDTVIDGRTGIFFSEQTDASLMEAIEQFEKIQFDRPFIQSHAASFDNELFKAKIKEYVQYKYEEHRKIVNKL